ncbi:MAG: glycosyltransferase family 39 protein [Anaerolineaceae bacterium]|nr:glycosyltransferase family 39 protein [Anaerolineaceae bacterium]
MKKNKWAKLFILAILLEGIVAGVIYFQNPSMEKNSVLWGYSASRLALGGIFIAMLTGIAITFLIFSLRPDRVNLLLDKFETGLIQKNRLLPVMFLLLLVILICIIYILIPWIPLPAQLIILRIIYARVMPFVLWVGLVCLQVIFLLFISYRKTLSKAEIYQITWQQFLVWGQKQAPIQPFIIIISSIFSLLPNLPKYNLIPTHDSGIFLYFGDQILNGKLPFRDLWDHKPPAVFYTDALGLWLGHGNRMGVWWLEVVAVTITGLLAYYFLKKFFGKWPAMFASCTAILNLIFVFEGGNLTEEFALPFQYLALFLFAIFAQKNKFGWKAVLIGVAGGFAFMYKQTMIGIWIVIAIMILSRAISEKNWRFAWKRLLYIVAGALFVCLLFVLYFAFQGQLYNFWDVAFRFNFIYSEVSINQRIEAFRQMQVWLTGLSPYYLLGLFSWVAAIIYLLLQRSRSQIIQKTPWFLTTFVIIASSMAIGSSIATFFYKDQILQFTFIGFTVGFCITIVIWALKRKQVLPEPLLQTDHPQNLSIIWPLKIAVLSLPIEILLISTSTQNYFHYFMVLFLPLSILIAFLFWSTAKLQQKGFSVLLFGILVFALWSYAGYTINRQMTPKSNEQVTRIVTYIKDRTDANDYVLVWGGQTVVNYVSQREAPTRFVHQMPLYKQGYASDALTAEFFSDLKTKQPKFIINALYPSTPFISFSADGECKLPESGYHESMREVFHYLCQHYHQKAIVGKDEWIVYELNQQ